MSQENVELVKRVIDAFNRRDASSYDELYAPDLEWLPLQGTVEREAFRGRGGLARYLEVIRDTWDEFRVIGEEFRDLGESVLVFNRIEARGKGSGVPVVERNAIVFEFRDHKVSRARSYRDAADALKAVGLI